MICLGDDKILMLTKLNLFGRFFGRRACIRGYEENSEEAKAIDDEASDEASKKEIKSSKDKKEEKSKTLKF